MNSKPKVQADRKLLALTRYGPTMGSSRVRFHQYLPALKSAGWSVAFSPLQEVAFQFSPATGKFERMKHLLRDYLARVSALLDRSRFDIIWVEKELLPYLPPVCERWLATRDVSIIVDYDDATFHVYDEHSNAIVRRVLGRKIDTIMRLSTLTVAGNSYLAKRADNAGAKNVVTIPSSVEFTRYQGHAGRSPNGRPVIGWIGSPSTAKYLYIVGPALIALQENMNARVVLVGSGPLNITGVDLEIFPWSEATEVKIIQSFDVGIMPIAMTNWERGKCGFKLIQYMAAGVPSVATAFGANNDIILQGRTGFLAETHEDWIVHLTHLLSSDAIRNEMGHKGKERVRNWYSTEANGPKLVDAFEQVLLEQGSSRGE